jgi:hypothetical protein
MRSVIVVMSLLIAMSPACRRRPPQQQNAAAAFTAPAQPGEEEKWTEPEPEDEPPPPPPPPPPPEPTSPPPEEALGFTFGQSRNQSMRKCSRQGAWGKRDGNYYCSRALDGASVPGKPVLSFCEDDKLCAVGVVVVVDTSDWAAWNARFEELKQALVALHGAPTVDAVNVGEDCKNEGFVKCLDEGTASAEATWKWKQGHRVSLTMSKKKSGEGPSAIRLVSIVGG